VSTYVPKSVEPSHENVISLLWNQQVKNDSLISNNKLDIIIRDNENGTCMFLYFINSGNRILIQKGTELILQ
jgi:hypothetical protein